MDSIYDFMSKDHDRLDEIFNGFKKIKNSNINTAKELFMEFKKGLERHIVWEEEILFPLFEKQTGMNDSGPTFVMRMEHVRIKEIISAIHEMIVKLDLDTDELENELVFVLTQHNDKEESILYPWIDNSISILEREEAFKKINATIF